MTEVLSGPSPQVQAVLDIITKIRQHLEAVERHFVGIAALCFKVREERLYLVLEKDLKEFVETELKGVNYKQFNILADIHEFLIYNQPVAFQGVPGEDVVAEIGKTAAERLIPLARRGELTEEWVRKAHDLPDLALREELGHKVPSSTSESVPCPQCGATVFIPAYLIARAKAKKEEKL